MTLVRFDAVCYQSGTGGTGTIYLDSGLSSLATLFDVSGNSLANPGSPDSHNFVHFQVDSAAFPTPNKYLVFLDAGDHYAQPIQSSMTPPTTGSTIRYGIGAPASGLGNVNDVYFNTTSGTGKGDVYFKTGASTWTLGFNCIGPAGATGTFTTPTGTGFAHVTAGVLDAAAVNYGTDGSHPAAGNCPAVNAAFIAALGAIVNDGTVKKVWVGGQAATLPSMSNGDLLVATGA